MEPFFGKCGRVRARCQSILILFRISEGVVLHVGSIQYLSVNTKVDRVKILLFVMFLT